MDNTKPLMEYLAPRAGESSADLRNRIAERQAAAVESRRRALAEQTSDVHPPAARIKIWEELHQVALPRNPTHRVLRIIAANTGLTLEEVRAEQRHRTIGSLAPKLTSAPP